MRTPLAAVALLALAVSPALAAPVTLTAVDSGFYNDAGNSPFSNGNYATGWFFNSQPSGEARDFFIFNLSSVSGTILSAKLHITMPLTAGYVSNDPTETLTLFDASTSPATLSSRATSLAVFNDLGTGSIYGSAAFSSANVNTDVDVSLNATGISFLNANHGQIAFGGAVTSFSTSDTYNQSMFSNSSTASTRQLILDVVAAPEPASMLMVGMGAAALLMRRRRA